MIIMNQVKRQKILKSRTFIVILFIAKMCNICTLELNTIRLSKTETDKRKEDKKNTQIYKQSGSMS